MKRLKCNIWMLEELKSGNPSEGARDRRVSFGLRNGAVFPLMIYHKDHSRYNLEKNPSIQMSWVAFITGAVAKGALDAPVLVEYHDVSFKMRIIGRKFTKGEMLKLKRQYFLSCV